MLPLQVMIGPGTEPTSTLTNLEIVTVDRSTHDG